VKPLTVTPGDSWGTQLFVVAAALVAVAVSLGILAGGIWLVSAALKAACQ
jgi:hypothetical protein